MGRVAPFQRKPREPLEYEVVMKEVHGQLVPVKVYAPIQAPTETPLVREPFNPWPVRRKSKRTRTTDFTPSAD